MKQSVQQFSQMNSVTICTVNEKDNVSDKKYKSKKNENFHVDIALSKKL